MSTPVAKAYLEYLYSDVGQDIIGRNFYRPHSPAALTKYGNVFVKVSTLVNITDFGGWPAAQATHFADGAIFDRITTP